MTKRPVFVPETVCGASALLLEQLRLSSATVGCVDPRGWACICDDLGVVSVWQFCDVRCGVWRSLRTFSNLVRGSAAHLCLVGVRDVEACYVVSDNGKLISSTRIEIGCATPCLKELHTDNVTAVVGVDRRLVCGLASGTCYILGLDGSTKIVGGPALNAACIEQSARLTRPTRSYVGMAITWSAKKLRLLDERRSEVRTIEPAITVIDAHADDGDIGAARRDGVLTIWRGDGLVAMLDVGAPCLALALVLKQRMVCVLHPEYLAAYEVPNRIIATDAAEAWRAVSASADMLYRYETRGRALCFSAGGSEGWCIGQDAATPIRLTRESLALGPMANLPRSFLTAAKGDDGLLVLEFNGDISKIHGRAVQQQHKRSKISDSSSSINADRTKRWLLAHCDEENVPPIRCISEALAVEACQTVIDEPPTAGLSRYDDASGAARQLELKEASLAQLLKRIAKVPDFAGAAAVAREVARLVGVTRLAAAHAASCSPALAAALTQACRDCTEGRYDDGKLRDAGLGRIDAYYAKPSLACVARVASSGEPVVVLELSRLVAHCVAAADVAAGQTTSALGGGHGDCCEDAECTLALRTTLEALRRALPVHEKRISKKDSGAARNVVLDLCGLLESRPSYSSKDADSCVAAILKAADHCAMISRARWRADAEAAFGVKLLSNGSLLDACLRLDDIAAGAPLYAVEHPGRASAYSSSRDGRARLIASVAQKPTLAAFAANALSCRGLAADVLAIARNCSNVKLPPTLGWIKALRAREAYENWPRVIGSNACLDAVAELYNNTQASQRKWELAEVSGNSDSPLDSAFRAVFDGAHSSTRDVRLSYVGIALAAIQQRDRPPKRPLEEACHIAAAPDTPYDTALKCLQLALVVANDDPKLISQVWLAALFASPQFSFAKPCLQDTLLFDLIALSPHDHPYLPHLAEAMLARSPLFVPAALVPSTAKLILEEARSYPRDRPREDPLSC